MTLQPFCPQKLSPLMVGMFKLLLPWLNARWAKGLQVSITPEDLKRLKSYKGESMLMLPNHPSNLDPYVMLNLSNFVGENFNYVAAREIFKPGIQQFLLQTLGCYSVIRGSADRESFRTTREILREGKNRLVIFIEGEVSHENNTLIPFETGVLQLAFWGLEDRIKAWKTLAKPGKASLFLAPIAIKYVYPPEAQGHLELSLRRLEEEALSEENARKARSMDTYDRIMQLGNTLLAVEERRLNLNPSPEDTLNMRLDALKERLLSKMEHFLDITIAPQTTFLDRIRIVRNKIDKTIYSYQDPEDLSGYELRMLALMRKELMGFYDELGRVVNLILLRDGSIADVRQMDRYVDVVRRLEREVYGEPLLNPPRTAHLRVGDILNLADYYPQYQTNKKAAIQDLGDHLESEMQQLIHIAVT